MSNRAKRALFCAREIRLLPNIDTTLLSQQDCELFDRRKKSLELYHSGASHSEILLATARSRQEVAYDIKRFLTADEFGNIYGWAALLPEKRIVAYEDPDLNRNKNRRRNILFARGSFSKLLASHPTVKTGLDHLIHGCHPNGKKREGTISPSQIHSGFLTLCREAGLTDRDYPLVTEDQGRRALFDYRKRCLARDPTKVLKALHGQEIIRELGKGVGREPAIMPPIRLFQRIEVDGHELPFVGTLELPGAHPLRPLLLELRHITLVFVVECGSAAILGYSVRFGKNYTARDVLRAMRTAILPWKQMNLSPSLGISYPYDGGLPTGLIPELAWAHWREMHWDNAPAHLSSFLLNQVPASVPVASPRAAPDTHSVIESVNGVIDRVFRDVPCGTAGGAKNAAVEAARLGMTSDLILQIIDVAIAGYNATPPAGTNISKIGLLRRYAQDPRSIITRIPQSLRERFRIYDFEAELTIQGSRRKTKNAKSISRPYIHFHHGDYTSTVLSKRFELIGCKLVVRGVSDDLAVLDCWFKDGSPFGQVKVLGPWGLSKHGFETRSAADRLRRKNKERDFSNPVEAVVRALQMEASQSSRAASQLALVLQETGFLLTTMDCPVLKQMDMQGDPGQIFDDQFPDLDTLY